MRIGVLPFSQPLYLRLPSESDVRIRWGSEEELPGIRVTDPDVSGSKDLGGRRVAVDWIESTMKSGIYWSDLFWRAFYSSIAADQCPISNKLVAHCWTDKHRETPRGRTHALTNSLEYVKTITRKTRRRKRKRERKRDNETNHVLGKFWHVLINRASHLPHGRRSGRKRGDGIASQNIKSFFCVEAWLFGAVRKYRRPHQPRREKRTPRSLDE